MEYAASPMKEPIGWALWIQGVRKGDSEFEA
jgi:hypothetical protein